jgi:hypothetical protein
MYEVIDVPLAGREVASEISSESRKGFVAERLQGGLVFGKSHDFFFRANRCTGPAGLHQ